METSGTKPIIATYTCMATIASVSIYRTHETDSPLSPEIKITPDMSKAKTKAKYWVTELDQSGIFNQPTTAMFDTKNGSWFFGDLENKKHLIVFQFSPHKEALRTFYFKDFYPRKTQQFVNYHINK